MKKLKFILIAAVAMFTACSKTTTIYNPVTIISRGYELGKQNENGEYGIFFGNYRPYTKATSNNGIFVGPNECGYDWFNMFAFKDGSAIMNPYRVEWDGSSWTYLLNGQEAQFFDKNSREHSFIGVISETTPVNNNGTVTVAADAFLDNSGELNTPKEVLYSVTNVPNSAYNVPVTLNFQHINAKMYIGFASDRNDTEIIDYTPYNPGSPAKDAWDETVEVTTYQTVAKPTPMLGPVIGTITDEDINYINSKYTSSLGWLSYYSSNSTFTGPLDENMWEYLVSKHPELTSEDLESWGTYANNSNMRLVHVDKNGHKSTDGDSYRGWFVNVQNVNWQGTTVTTTVHHDAVPAIPASGIEGIRVFSVNTENEKFVIGPHTTNANVNIASTANIVNVGSSLDVITFQKPTGPVAYFATKEAVIPSSSTLSPSVWYALPVSNPTSGYVVKFSYTYNGVDHYDARVNIPFEDSDFKPGYYYKFIIYITDHTNGGTDPDKANNEKDDVDMTEYPVNINVHVTKYESGKEVVYQL